MYPRKLNKKEISKLKKEFPLTREELQKLERNREERIKCKLEMIVIVFLSIVLVGALYLFYLTLTGKTIGWL